MGEIRDPLSSLANVYLVRCLDPTIDCFNYYLKASPICIRQENENQ